MLTVWEDGPCYAAIGLPHYLPSVEGTLGAFLRAHAEGGSNPLLHSVACPICRCCQSLAVGVSVWDPRLHNSTSLKDSSGQPALWGPLLLAAHHADRSALLSYSSPPPLRLRHPPSPLQHSERRHLRHSLDISAHHCGDAIWTRLERTQSPRWTRTMSCIRARAAAR